jgi:lipopolysaccharide transport system ATP-binding protein
VKLGLARWRMTSTAGGIAFAARRIRTPKSAKSTTARSEQPRTKNQAPKHDSASPDYVWALRDVSFEVKQGEVLGIIGRNGAGKSTLLKLLSRVTAPTSGIIKSKGRIASLLEVGTGFHPELTGRENVYLNGAILGMRRSEITRQLEEIIEFSGCAKYIDTPVKRYSSGMTVRLGFSVAAHLQCEILVVDEVLAVGDAEFQSRCIGKMQEFSKGGKTVLFVSHNLESVQRLCQNAIVLRNGKQAESGSVDEMITFYNQVDERTQRDVRVRSRPVGQSAAIESVELCGNKFFSDGITEFAISISVSPESTERYYLALYVYDSHSREIVALDTSLVKEGLLTPYDTNVSIKMKSPWLKPGQYRVNAVLYSNVILDNYIDACIFSVGTKFSDESGLYVSRSLSGIVVPQLEFIRHCTMNKKYTENA